MSKNTKEETNAKEDVALKEEKRDKFTMEQAATEYESVIYDNDNKETMNILQAVTKVLNDIEELKKGLL